MHPAHVLARFFVTIEVSSWSKVDTQSYMC